MKIGDSRTSVPPEPPPPMWLVHSYISHCSPQAWDSRASEAQRKAVAHPRSYRLYIVVHSLDPNSKHAAGLELGWTGQGSSRAEGWLPMGRGRVGSGGGGMFPPVATVVILA